jgi:uncharacterized OsmC-like protein
MKSNPELTESIKTAFERGGRALELRPAVGQKTAITKVRVIEGVHCVAEEGRWTVEADMSEKSGGTGKAHDPSLIVRSALGLCFAMGYVIWAANLGVPISDVEVEIEADFDVRGQHNVPGVVPGFSEIRYHVRIESTASEADLQRVIEQADQGSVVGDVFRREHKLVRSVSVTRPGG